jgi:hypothetical protein
MSHSLEVSFKGKIPKEELYPEAIEDYFEISDDKKIIAVCDGASESFDSKVWAELLCHKYIQEPLLSESWISSATEAYSGRTDFTSLSWSKQAAFNRGSFSTLLGLQFYGNDTVDITAVGDSIAVMLEGDRYVTSFPYTEAGKFQERPYLISTNTIYNQFINDGGFPNAAHWDFSGIKSCSILCMTDAMAEWALKQNENGSPVWDKLLSLNEMSDFCDCVKDARANREMKADDSTLIVIKII